MVISLAPSLMSALATGWLHVEADGLADMTKSYSFFLHRVRFSASFSPDQMGNLLALVVTPLSLELAEHRKILRRVLCWDRSRGRKSTNVLFRKLNN